MWLEYPHDRSSDRKFQAALFHLETVEMTVVSMFLAARRAVIVFMPGIVPLIAFFIELRRGNPYCWFWLIGGLVMATGLLLSIKHPGWHGFVTR